MDSGSYRDTRSVQAEIVAIAGAMIAGDMDLVSGARSLYAMQADFDPAYRDLFLPIIAFESQTDDYPTQEARGHYQLEYLNKLDAELHDFLRETQPEILAACRRIVQALAKP